MATVAADRRRDALGAERLFFAVMAAVVLASTIAGFAPSYYLRPVLAQSAGAPGLTPLIHLHGIVFSAWVLLFMAQVALVGAGRTDLHRRLGMAGVGLIALMAPLGLAVGIGTLTRHSGPPGLDPRSWAAVPLLDLPVFAGLAVAALALRRRPATHKRLMLVAMIDLLRPSIGRLVPMLGGSGPLALMLPIVFLLPLIGFDLATRGRVHPATLVGSTVVATSILVTPMVWSTGWWMAFAGSLAG